jgi:hypothetical protein
MAQAPIVGDGAAPVPIGLVQGVVAEEAPAATHVSPLEDQRVTVQGIVHQRLLRHGRRDQIENGFFIQNTVDTADGDPRSSDGIFVYTQQKETVQALGGGAEYVPRVGDELVIAGRVREIMQMTHLTVPRLVRLVRSGVDPAAALPAAALPAFPDVAEADRFWERHEGMRLAVPGGALVMGGRRVYGGGRDAEVWVLPPAHPVAARPEPFARRVFRDPHPLDDQPDVLFDNDNPRMIVVGSLGLKGLRQDPFALIPPLRTFTMLVDDEAAAVYQRFETYSLQPTRFPDYRPGPDPADNGRLPASDPDTDFTVATFNVENLYDHRDDPDDPSDAVMDPGTSRVTPPFNYLPASEAAYRRKLRGLARIIAEDLRAPDLLLLQEIEDQDLDGDGIQDVLADLIATIREAGGPLYQSASDRAGADYRGIICAFLYRSERLVPTAADPAHPVLGDRPEIGYRGDTVRDARGARNPKALNALLPLDVDVNTGMTDSNVFSRAVQAARFAWVERPDAPPLIVLNNHFASRPDQRVGQRREQAALNAAVAAAFRRAEPGADLVLGGDLNVYPRPDDPLPQAPSDQLGPLYGAELVNLYDTMLRDHPAGAYTYVYRGQAGTLDQLFVSPGLSARLRFVTVLHVNSDWPAGVEEESARGVSDHDPVVAAFPFARP